MAIEKIPREAEAATTFNQDTQLLGDWFNFRRGEKLLPFHLYFSYYLKKDVDIQALQGAVQALGQRHEVFKIALPDLSNLPGKRKYEIFGKIAGKDGTSIFTQRLVDTAHLELSIMDEPADSRSPGREVEILLQEECERTFNYSAAPLARATLFRLVNKELVLLVVLHHLIADRWSVGTCQRDLEVLYQQLATGATSSSLPECPIQFLDFAAWERAQVASGSFGKLIEYWIEQWEHYLPGHLTTDDLPLTRRMAALPSYCVDLVMISLDSDLTGKARTFARSSRITLFMLWLTAFSILFHLYTQKTKLILLSNLSNRTELDTEYLMGWFANAVLLGVSVDPHSAVRKLLEHVRGVVLQAQSHQAVPHSAYIGGFLKYQRNELDLTKWITLDFISAAERQTCTLGESLAARQAFVPPIQRRMVLQLAIFDEPDSMTMHCVYSRDRFSRSHIEQMLRHVRAIVKYMIDYPDTSISRMSSALDVATATWMDPP